MNPEFDEVLLTAYLDNEVTEAERARVEEQLRASEASRLLLEELRSVRTLVEQLHLSQPSRNFQIGPWNENNETSQTSPVGLNIDGSHWKISYQRLASIAALIAIAICASVLLLGPNRNSISRLESTDTDASSTRTLSLQAENKDLPSMEKNNADTAVSRSRGADGASFDTSQTGLAIEDSPVGIPGAFGGPVRSAPLAKHKASPSETNDVELVPAPVVVDPLINPALGLSNPADPLQRLQRLEPSTKLLLESLFEKQASGNNEWESLDSLRTQDSFFRSNGRSEDFVQRSDAMHSTSDESIARFSFRYKPTTELELALAEKLHDKDAKITSAAKPTNENGLTDGVVDSKLKEVDVQRKNLSLKTAEDTLIVEFQIPREDWENGAKRLRDLGVEVPLELPESEYLDFVATTKEAAKDEAPESLSNAPVTRLQVDAKDTGSRELSRWKLQRPEQLGRAKLELRTMRKSELEKEAVPETNGREWNGAYATVRIRVRAIKK